MTASIRIKELEKRFGDNIIFDGLDISIPEKKITALFGPNGAGKSTLFDIISGLEKKDKGIVSIYNFSKNNFSYVTQNYRETLLPWCTNFANIALPLRIQDIPRELIQKRVHSLLQDLDISIEMEAYPYQLSGGQQQIITLLRALVTKPKLLLLDEPFSALDYENSLKWRDIIQEYFLKTKTTIFIITHDIEEAVYLASNILVLSRKPSAIVNRIENPLLYPRHPQVFRSKQFIDTIYKTLTSFQSVL